MRISDWSSDVCSSDLALARATVRITLVDRGNHHLFQPLLYQVATPGLSAPDIAAPLRHILQWQRIAPVLVETVADIDNAAREVRHERGDALRYAHLLLARGAPPAPFGSAEWAPPPHALHPPPADPHNSARHP